MWGELAQKGEIDKIFKSADDDENDPEQQVIAQEKAE